MTGFCSVLVNPLGPVHAYLSGPVKVVLALSVKLFPAQIGPLLLSVGIPGVGLITTVTCAGAEVQLLSVAVTK